ncbi:MAG TPA: glycosyltransferase [Planctomycetota bacterium]
MPKRVATNTASVAIVVVNWNGLELTRECLHSLLVQTWLPAEIHVVDNGSANAEAAALRGEFGPRIRLHELPRNAGFTGGCNAAMEVALAEARCEFIALLDNGAVAEANWLEELVREMRSDERIGIVTSRMRLFDEPDLLDNAGAWLLSNGDVSPRGRRQHAADWERAGDLLAACGGAVLLRCSMLQRIGLFRLDFFANFEHADLSLRAFVAGWRIRYAPRAEVRHRLEAAIGRLRDHEFHARSVRNATWVFLVNLPLPVLLLNLPACVLSNLLVALVLPFCGRRGAAWAFVRGRCRAIAELRAIAAERRRLRPLRRASSWRLWLAQRSFVAEYVRLALDAVRRRKTPVAGSGTIREQSRTETSELLHKAKGGDSDAMDHLFSRYYERVRRSVRARLSGDLRSRGDLDDALRPHLTKAFESFDRFEMRHEGSFLHWLAEYAAQNIHDASSPEPVPPAPGRDDARDRAALEACLGQLAEPHRRIIELRDYQGLGWDEIAEKMGMNGESAAREWHRRAMVELARLMAGRGRGPERG